ncbi:MAG: DUF6465 family protein [Enterocloster bolteae]
MRRKQRQLRLKRQQPGKQRLRQHPRRRQLQRKQLRRRQLQRRKRRKRQPPKQQLRKKPRRRHLPRRQQRPKAAVHFQFDGKDLVAKDVLDRAVKAFKKSHRGVEIKTIDLYIVANEGAAYYVVNGEGGDDYKIIL